MKKSIGWWLTEIIIILVLGCFALGIMVSYIQSYGQVREAVRLIPPTRKDSIKLDNLIEKVKKLEENQSIIIESLNSTIRFVRFFHDKEGNKGIFVKGKMR